MGLKMKAYWIFNLIYWSVLLFVSQLLLYIASVPIIGPFLQGLIDAILL